MQFGEGITAIVGPNGCGKTNIVDAIRWVLGEQKYSVLRSGKMEDVIFSGADTLKPLSVCEVSLTVHNNKGKLPLEYNDVEIGRRVFRNGDSEYYINRTPCRLKDIQDLFVDTGMGADAYSVIELKMIEQILSETTDDRKRMFEEAAGINKYKQQRRSTLRKFEAVRTDLERANDIIAEVEFKVRSLALQLKRFERHAKLSDELCQREIALAFIKIKEYEETATPLKKKITDFKHLKESTATETTIYENELVQLKSVYQTQQTELDKLSREISEEVDKRDSAQKDVLVATEQKRSAKTTVERLERETGINETRISQLVQHKNDYEQETDKLLPKIDSQLVVYKKEKSEFDSIDKKYKKTQTDLDILQDKRWAEQRKIADQESLHARTQDMLIEKESQLESLEGKQAQINTGSSELRRERLEIEKELKSLLFQLEKQNVRQEKASSVVSGLEVDEQDAIRKEHSLKTKAEVLENQIQFYSNLLESKEGVSSGVKYVLDNPREFKGVHGVCAELMIVEKSYEAVIESVLGNTASFLVVADRITALETLRNLKEGKHGSAAIIPLKEFSNVGRTTIKTPKNRNVIASAMDVVSSDKKYDQLISALLGRVLIVNDFAKAVNDKQLSGWDLVDMDGTFSGTNTILKQSRNGKGLVGRKDKLESLKGKMTQNIKDQDAIEKTLADLNSKLQKARTDQETINSLVSEMNNELKRLEQLVLQYQIRQEQSEEKHTAISREIDEIKAAIVSLQKSLKKLTPSAKRGEKLLSQLADQLTKANEELLIIRTRRDEFHKQVQDLRIDVLNLENQRDNLQFQKRTAEDSIGELKKRQDEIKKEIIDLKETQKILSAKADQGEKELQKANAVVKKKRSVLDLKKETVQETYNEIEAIQSKIRDEHHSRENLLENLKNAELEIAEIEQRGKLVAERIKDRYDQSIPKELNVNESANELEERVEKINRSIENIGPINMAVKDEHETETERLVLLNEQKEDLEKSEKNLKETIHEIDKEARKLFMETFDQIKVNFEKLFSMFFEGGNGSLTLVGDPDPLESDIAINAQPPGKKNNSLRMLSAGEKSLTAIALLFSIYQYKPSPYCILDEVDAPLDDVNIRKFTKVLEAFADETQFIVVTHNKLTMEAANYLFGVTMEQKGVSKLVSVKFDA